MTVSVFDHPLLGSLLGDPETAELFSVEQELGAMLRFEAALAEAQAECGVIPDAAAQSIVKAVGDFKPDMEQLRVDTARDGMVVPGLVRQLRAALPPSARPHLHFCTTSQDVIDTALTVRLKPIVILLGRRLEQVVALLAELEGRLGRQPLIARTRMQRALPVTLMHRLRNWAEPLAGRSEDLERISAKLLSVQLGGPVGTGGRRNENALPAEGCAAISHAVAANLAERLGLGVPERNWHTDRQRLVAFADWLSQVSGHLGKIGMDVVLMCQDEIAEAKLAGAGSSSAMAHKQNPVAGETLVALARLNAALVGAMHGALVHEQERSGSAWTMEWMILPQMTVATASGLRAAHTMLSGISFPVESVPINTTTGPSQGL